MNWTDFGRAVAERSGVPLADTRAVLREAVAVATDEIAAGGSVTLWGLGTLGSRWLKARTLRHIQTQQKIRIDGRHVAAFRPAAALQRALLGRSPQTWRDQDHQLAYRLSEALIGDLAAYHAADAPMYLPDDLAAEDTRARCAEAFGELWDQITQTYAGRVPDTVSTRRDYLAEAARRRWGTPPSA